MSIGTGQRHGAIAAFWVLVLLGLLAPPARAQGIRPAREPIVGSRLRHVVEMIPGSNTDLPPFLRTPRDVYLLVTAGAAYTEVEVLANPEVSAPSVAQALSSAAAGTPLAGQAVTWSADSYAAAQVSEKHSRFGAMGGSNVVPVGALVSGLRRAGLAPHLLLRVAGHARAASLPPSRFGTRAFRWYDARSLGSRGSVAVTAQTTWRTPVYLLLYFSLPLLICLFGLGLAGVISGRGRRDDMARRLLFRRINGYALVGALVAQVGAMQFLLLRTSVPAALSDLWLGSSATTGLVPFLVIAVVPFMLSTVWSRRLENRRFGAVAADPLATIPMSDEEKAVRKRVAQYSMVPHLVGTTLLLAVLFAVPRTSPLHSVAHPIAIFLPLVGASLVPRLFKKRLDQFTQKTLDDGLTWRARQLGQALGVRMPDVFVEDSSRAAHLAFATHQGHHVTLSRKLQATFTAAETDFVLAHHLACMKGRGGDKRWLRSLLPLPMLVPVFLILSPRLFPNAPALTTMILMPWFFPALIGYFGLSLVLVLVLGGSSGRRQMQQVIEADRSALGVAGDLTAAESVLHKLALDALSSEKQAAAHFNSGLPGAAKVTTQLESGRLMLRRAALQKTAQTLRFAPGAEPAPADLGPFSSSDADRRYETDSRTSE